MMQMGIVLLVCIFLFFILQGFLMRSVFYTKSSFLLSKSKQYFPQFPLAELDMPLRTTKAVLKTAGLDGDTVSKEVTVTGSGMAKIEFSVPPHLLPGVDGEIFYYSDYDDKDQIVQAVAAARLAMVKRMGNCGVPVICIADDAHKYNWIHEGLQLARPTFPPAINYSTKLDDGNEEDPKNATIDDVKTWLENRSFGQEERDIILCEKTTRGWEVDTHIVLHLTGGTDYFPNLVMRGMANVILVTKKPV